MQRAKAVRVDDGPCGLVDIVLVDAAGRDFARGRLSADHARELVLQIEDSLSAAGRTEALMGVSSLCELAAGAHLPAADFPRG
jgi:hypothetical protein